MLEIIQRVVEITCNYFEVGYGKRTVEGTVKCTNDNLLLNGNDVSNAREFLHPFQNSSLVT